MTAALLESLSTLAETSEPCEYARTGFHQRHVVSTANLVELARTFLDAGHILEMITCEDRRAAGEGMRLAYTFNRLEEVDRHLVFLTVPAEAEVAVDHEFDGAPTLSGLVGGADWMEREIFDMYGVRFEGHANLQRILLPEDAQFFPLRKDFGRPEDAEDADG
ncbi:MAG: NADH-quinone oxidoreductase subunit C [Planctomycetes bacterium]|nr:NADH-quinone oxidoreductase subunit C [Planctomycetota bacterium]